MSEDNLVGVLQVKGCCLGTLLSVHSGGLFFMLAAMSFKTTEFDTCTMELQIDVLS